MSEQALTADEGIGSAFMQALLDLAKLRLIDFQNVYYGNTLTQLGRDVRDLSIESPRSTSRWRRP